MKLESIKPGMTLWSILRSRMGNTTLKTYGTYTVKVISVNPERRTVTASWNHNPPMEHFERVWSKWKLKRPLLIKNSLGQYRLATREEIKHEKEALERKAQDQHRAGV